MLLALNNRATIAEKARCTVTLLWERSLSSVPHTQPWRPILRGVGN
jgi:hypothetical protein